MFEPDSYSLSRYLNAKRSVDECALNRGVEQAFLRTLERAASTSADRPLRLVEIGAGTGGSSERLLEAVVGRGLGPVEYTLVDQDADLLVEARRRLRTWGEKRKTAVTVGDRDGSEGGDDVRIRAVQGDALTYLFERPDSFVAVIANSFADLESELQQVSAAETALLEGGSAYFTFIPSGETSFLPAFHQPELDREVESVYHESMSRSTPHGKTAGARAGQQLLYRFSQVPFSLVEGGASDWIIVPDQGGGYPGDEAYFLHHILHFVEQELRDNGGISPDQIDAWVRTRHRQVEEGELIYIGGHLDLVAQLTHPSKSGASST